MGSRNVTSQAGYPGSTGPEGPREVGGGVVSNLAADEKTKTEMKEGSFTPIDQSRGGERTPGAGKTTAWLRSHWPRGEIRS